MANPKPRKGSKLVCVPCGREITVDCCGTSASTIWCCGKPMKSKAASKPKKSAAKK